MIAVNRNLSIDVSLAGDNQGRNNVLLSLSGTTGPVICVSPEQARCLALELIDAVHKAEVRLSLDKSQATKSRPAGAVKNNILQLG
jgi:hypothetical protein